ncbi:MAG: N-acetylneuraminate synthase family protein [Thermodesulfobacteriota bacterium]|nr:N-acetylneuraminate synthase family protein [Thermodesulfobacteriota bacterium]
MKAVIVAEAASNHNGDIGIAREMIHAAKEAGADVIKFQSYLGSNVRDNHPDKERFMSVNLSDEAHFELMEECRKAGITFYTTCFDIGRIDFLRSLGLKNIKVASYDMVSRQMVGKLADNFSHLILSTGSVPRDEIKKTVDMLKTKNGCRFTLLHCTTLYPTPPEKVRLMRMNWLRTLTPNVGFSDHTLGVDVPKAAIAMGAVMIEKHFTLDKKMKGRSHHLACDPVELRELADYAVFFEKIKGEDPESFSKEELNTYECYRGLLGEGI